MPNYYAGSFPLDSAAILNAFIDHHIDEGCTEAKLEFGEDTTCQTCKYSSCLFDHSRDFYLRKKLNGNTALHDSTQ